MTGDPSRRVHIVDDDELVRASVSYLFSNHGYSTEIYASGAEFFRDCPLERGCILLDICMPQMDGHEVQEELARRGNTMPVVVMSAHGYIPGVVRAMKLGAVDFIEKTSRGEDLLGAVDRAMASFRTSRAQRNVTAAAEARLNRLSKRQRQILQGLLDGLANKGIARRLGVSPRTVEMHRAKLLVELGATSLAEAVRFALDAGLSSDSQSRAPNASAPRPDSLFSAGA
jgi:FixJ family two-component response regulator